MLAADVETFSSETVFTDYDGLVFEGSENTLFKDLFYSESRKVYAALSGYSILLFNENLELSNTISVPNDLGNVKRLTADNNYIYVLYSKNGLYEPNINIYDYDGNFVGRTRIPINLGDLNTPYPENSSVQGIVMYGDDLYVTISRWNKNGVNSDGFKLLKLSVPEISDVELATFDIKPLKVSMKEMVQAGYFRIGEKFFNKQGESAVLADNSGKLTYNGETKSMHEVAALMMGQSRRVNAFDFLAVERNGCRVSINDVREDYRRHCMSTLEKEV